jgi:hypothetical protein
MREVRPRFGDVAQYRLFRFHVLSFLNLPYPMQTVCGLQALIYAFSVFMRRSI